MASTPIDQTEVEALRRQLAEMQAAQAALQAQLAAAQQAHVDGSGAATQGGGDALGAHSVQVQGDNAAPINTGTAISTAGGAVIEGAVEVRNGHVIGRDFVQTITQIIPDGADQEEAKSVIALYLYALVSDLAGLRLGEIDVAAQETKREPLQLADVYVPLDTTALIPVDLSLAQWLSRDRNRKPDGPREQKETRPVSVLEALAKHRELTVLGKPGSGKIGRDLDDSGYGLSADAMNYVQRIARNHGALILLDGLDECGSRASRGRVLN